MGKDKEEDREGSGNSAVKDAPSYGDEQLK